MIKENFSISAAGWMIPKFKILNFESFLINIIYSGNAVSETSFIRFQNLRQINFYFIGHNLLLTCFPAWSAWYGYLSIIIFHCLTSRVNILHLQESTTTTPTTPTTPPYLWEGLSGSKINSSPHAVHTTGCKGGSKSSFLMGIIAEHLRSTI
mgnify:CR=1 FL=1